MSTPQFGEPGYNPGTQAYTPEQLGAVRDQVQPPPLGTGPDPADLDSKMAGLTATETDVNALLAQMQAQMAAMAEQIATMKSGQVASGEHPVIGAAAAARDLVATHFEFHRKGPELIRLADDNLDAARNAVDSGDTGALRQVNSKLERALLRWHPGPGDHHYFTQALAHVQVHIPDAADTVTQAKPSNATAVGSSQPPARVLQGSVTG
jgi:hypothetical protein